LAQSTYLISTPSASFYGQRISRYGHIKLIANPSIFRVLLSAPRRSAGIPNSSGTFVAYTQTTYSFVSHSTTSELRVLDVSSGKSSVLSDTYQGSPQWLGDGNYLVWLRGGDDGNTSFVIGDAGGVTKPYIAGTVSGPVSDLKVTTIAPGKVGFAVSGKA